MANELWIRDSAGFHGWTVTEKGDLSTETDYEPETRQVLDVGVEGSFNQVQADTIRELIAELVQIGLLDEYPNRGVQYPTGAPSNIRYLRCWPDDTDQVSTADLGLSTQCPWEDAVPVDDPVDTEPPGQATICEGDEHELVTEWQVVCNEILADAETEEDYFLDVDGVFGSETRKTTKLVQSVLKVPTTGIVDQATWEAVQ